MNRSQSQTFPEDDRKKEEILFDIYGQYAFGDLGLEPFGNVLRELELPPTVHETWLSFSIRSARSRQQSGSESIPQDVLADLPVVKDPEMELWWEEFIKDPTQETWSQLVNKEHASQTQPKDKTQEASTSDARSRPPRRSQEASTSATGTRPKTRQLSPGQTRQASDEEDEDIAFHSRSRSSSRRRTTSIHMSDYGFEGESDAHNSRPKKKVSVPKKAAKKTVSSSSRSKGKQKMTTPPRPLRKSTITALERREQNAAMKNRVTESDLSSGSGDDFEIIEDDEDEEASQHGDENETDNPLSSSPIKCKRGAKKRDTTKDAPDVIDVEDIEDDSEPKEDGTKNGGVGSKGSAFVQYYCPGARSREWKIKTVKGKQVRYSVKVQLFRCRFCDKPVRVIGNKPSPLALHLNPMAKSAVCKNRLTPNDKSLNGTFGPVPAAAAPSTVCADGNLIRRLALVWIVRECLPFTIYKSNAFRDLIKAINAEVLTCFKSPRQNQRDSRKLAIGMEQQALAAISDQRFSIQLDEWSSPGGQHAFQATVVSYIDDNWDFHQYAVDFQILRGCHSGETYSGHFVDLLTKHSLLTNWNGAITTDSASSNVMMGRLIQERLEEDECETRFKPSQNHVRCFAHHLNLVVHVLYSALGVPTKVGRRKVVTMDGPEEDSGPNLDTPERRAKLLSGLDSDDEDEDEDDDFLEDELPEEEEGAEDDDPDALTPTTSGPIGPDDDEAELDPAEASESLVADLSPHVYGEELETIVEADEEELEAEKEKEVVLPEVQTGEGGEEVQDVEMSAAELSQSQSQDQTSSGQPQRYLSPLVKVATIVKIARSSPERRRRFLRVAKQAYAALNRPVKAAKVRIPPAFNKTRRNSRFFQLRVALRFAKALTSVVQSDDREDYGAHLDLKADEIRLLKRTVLVLGYFLVLTKEVEVKGPTSADILTKHLELAHVLDVEIGISRETGGTVGNFFADALQKAADKLRSYREQAIKCLPLLLAHVLHPENRLLILKSDLPGKVDIAKKALKEEIAKYTDEKPVQKAGRSSTGPIGPPQWRREPAPVDAGEEDELEAYLAGRYAWREGEDPLKWWKDNAGNFPVLSKVARKILATTGSTAYVERVLSAAGRICSVRRRSIAPATLRDLLLTEQWIQAGFDTLQDIRPTQRNNLQTTPMVSLTPNTIADITPA